MSRGEEVDEVVAEPVFAREVPEAVLVVHPLPEEVHGAVLATMDHLANMTQNVVRVEK